MPQAIDFTKRQKRLIESLEKSFKRCGKAGLVFYGDAYRGLIAMRRTTSEVAEQNLSETTSSHGVSQLMEYCDNQGWEYYAINDVIENVGD